MKELLSNPSFVIIMIALAVFMIWAFYPKKPPEPPKPNDKDAAAIELLKGGNAEEIAKANHISVEELNKWKDEFLDSALTFARNKNEYIQRARDSMV